MYKALSGQIIPLKSALATPVVQISIKNRGIKIYKDPRSCVSRKRSVHTKIGPSEVSACAVTKIQEGVVIGFRIFAWAPNSHTY